MNKNKRKLMDLKSKRSAHIDAATAAYDAGDKETYNSEMALATGMNDEITELQQLVDEEARFAGVNPQPADEDKLFVL